MKACVILVIFLAGLCDSINFSHLRHQNRPPNERFQSLQTTIHSKKIEDKCNDQVPMLSDALVLAQQLFGHTAGREAMIVYRNPKNKADQKEDDEYWTEEDFTDEVAAFGIKKCRDVADAFTPRTKEVISCFDKIQDILKDSSRVVSIFCKNEELDRRASDIQKEIDRVKDEIKTKKTDELEKQLIQQEALLTSTQNMCKENALELAFTYKPPFNKDYPYVWMCPDRIASLKKYIDDADYNKQDAFESWINIWQYFHKDPQSTEGKKEIYLFSLVHLIIHELAHHECACDDLVYGFNEDYDLQAAKKPQNADNFAAYVSLCAITYIDPGRKFTDFKIY